MKYDLSLFEAEVKKGNLRKSEDQDLVLYNYTDQCTYNKAWNEITLMSRGIIFEKATGELVAKPFPKFFNLGEREETFLKNLPNEPFTVAEKYDGSLGIIFNYKNRWRVATRGSLNSPQAQKAQEMLRWYGLTKVPQEITLLVEIVYPENKIVVNYGDEEALVLLGAYDTITEDEIPRNLGDYTLKVIERDTGLGLAQFHNYGIQEMIELQKTMPKDQEGFVVRFYGGLRVKIKGDEYMRIAKMLSHMSPLSFWESMVDGVVNKEYLQQLPEEFRKDFEPIVTELEKQYAIIRWEIYNDVDHIVSLIPIEAGFDTPESRKFIGQTIQASPEIFMHPNAIFPFFTSSKAVDNYIMKQIRPTGNVMVSR